MVHEGKLMFEDLRKDGMTKGDFNLDGRDH